MFVRCVFFVFSFEVSNGRPRTTPQEKRLTLLSDKELGVFRKPVRRDASSVYGRSVPKRGSFMLHTVDRRSQHTPHTYAID